jgi:hypothetical protein
MSVAGASKLLGIPDATLRSWLTTDKTFQEATEQAAARWTADKLGDWNKATSSDWKAAEALLKSSPLTRSDWAQVATRGSGPAVQVVVNVPRGESAPMEAAEIVTIEQQAGNADPSPGEPIA